MANKSCSLRTANIDLSECSALGLDIAEWATILGGIAILIGLAKWLTGKFRTNAAPKIGSFEGLRKTLRPFVDDNTRIFRTFGPNSNAADGLPKLVRTDLTAWNEIKPQIAANNRKIKKLISNNFALVPTGRMFIFERWLSHIDAFEAHLKNSDVDYRQHQFPIEVLAMVHE